MDDFDRGERRVLYGANELVIPVKSPLALMGEEMIHPFFIFQYASVTIWCGGGSGALWHGGWGLEGCRVPLRVGELCRCVSKPVAAAAGCCTDATALLPACCCPSAARPAAHRHPARPAPALGRCLQAYYSYSLIIMGMTLFSIITNVASAYRYRRRLAALAHYTCEVQVRQGRGVVGGWPIRVKDSSCRAGACCSGCCHDAGLMVQTHDPSLPCRCCKTGASRRSTPQSCCQAMWWCCTRGSCPATSRSSGVRLLRLCRVQPCRTLCCWFVDNNLCLQYVHSDASCATSAACTCADPASVAHSAAGVRRLWMRTC